MCLSYRRSLKLAARGSASHGNPVNGPVDTAWAPTTRRTSSRSRHDRHAGGCCVLGCANILLESRGGSSSESPFASDAGEATARYEVPIYCGLASVCRVVAQSWAFLQHGCRRTRGLLIDVQYLFAHSVMPCAEKGSQALPDDREATFHSHQKPISHCLCCRVGRPKTYRDISQPWDVRPAEQRGRLTEAMRQSSDVKGSLGKKRWGEGAVGEDGPAGRLPD